MSEKLEILIKKLNPQKASRKFNWKYNNIWNEKKTHKWVKKHVGLLLKE